MTTEKTKENYFTKLSSIKLETEKKGTMKLNYVTWSEAWSELKKIYPNSRYYVFENENKMPYFVDNAGAFVKVSVTIVDDKEEHEHTILLPVMDYSNKAVKKEQLDVMHINKAIQRALTKAIAMHGLGIFVFKGEDLPEDDVKIQI